MQLAPLSTENLVKTISCNQINKYTDYYERDTWIGKQAVMNK